MKEVKIVAGSMWLAVGMVGTAIIIAGASVFVALQYNRTQWDIANLQKDTQITASQNIENGLNGIGSGVCKASRDSVLFC